MVEQRSTSTETADAPRMEYLLGVLRSLSQQDPPPALRDRLRLLSYQRLGGGVAAGQPTSGPSIVAQASLGRRPAHPYRVSGSSCRQYSAV